MLSEDEELGIVERGRSKLSQVGLFERHPGMTETVVLESEAEMEFRPESTARPQVEKNQTPPEARTHVARRKVAGKVGGNS